MKSTELNYYQKAVIENAKWVDSILLTGLTLAGTVVVAKAIGTTEFELLHLKISLGQAWVVFSLMTIAHFYTSWLLNREILRLWVTHTDEKCHEVFQEIRATGGVFVRGISPRTNKVKTILGFQIYEMRLDDPSTWAAHVFAILLIAAIVPSDLANTEYFFLMLLIAVIITIINWSIGSLWIVPLSELAIPHSQSIILSNKSSIQKNGGRNILLNLAPVAKGLTASITCAASLFGVLIAIGAGTLVTYLSSPGYDRSVLKALIAMGVFLIIPRAIKKVLRIQNFGKVLFIVLYILFTAMIITGSIAWIR